MGVFVICRRCNQKVYLEVRTKTELAPLFTVRCPFCSLEHTYRQFEATEEHWDFTCSVCNGRFFIRNPPPRLVRCPHCSSRIEIDYSGRLYVLERSQPPVPAPGARPVAGAIVGSLLGGVVAGPIGALLGMIAGGAIGASAEYLEARED